MIRVLPPAGASTQEPVSLVVNFSQTRDAQSRLTTQSSPFAAVSPAEGSSVVDELVELVIGPAVVPAMVAPPVAPVVALPAVVAASVPVA